MKILHGFVQGVVDKQGDKGAYAVIGINDVSTNSSGFEETSVVEFMVTGKQFKDGLHNAFRQLKGVEVYVPFTDRINTFNGFSSIRYQLQGLPMRLQQAPAAETSRPAPAAAPAARQA
jgi:hypothetical protein